MIWAVIGGLVLLLLFVVILVVVGVAVAARGKGGRPGYSSTKASQKSASKIAPVSPFDDPQNSPFVDLAEHRRHELIHNRCREAVDEAIQEMQPGLKPKTESSPATSKPAGQQSPV